MFHGPGGGLSREVERAGDFRATLRRLLQYLRPYAGHLVASLLLVLVNTVLTVAAPGLIGQAVDLLWGFVSGDVEAARALSGLNRNMLLLLGAYAGGWAAIMGSFYVMVTMGQNVLYNLRSQIFGKIQELSLGFFDQHEAGDLMSRLTNDTDVINQVLTMGLNRFFSSALTLVGILLAMLALNWRLALVSFSVLPIMVLSTVFFSGRARRAFRLTRKTIGGVSAELEENIAGVKVAQAFSREQVNVESFRQVSAANRDANVTAESITAAFAPTLDVLATVGVAIVVGFGGYLVLNNLATVGIIVAFVQYVRRFFEPVRAISMIWANLQSAIAGAERIFELLDTPPAIVDAANAVELPTIEGRIAFEDVCFEYNPGERVLEDVDLVAEPGQTVALVGPTGTGKTTVINLIGRFYDVCGGRVTVDGHDVREVSHASLRRQMGIVLQDTFLFSGTVMENIRYGRLGASDEEVVEAAKLANAHDFITRLPQGYHTELTEQASNLSQGQRQLISIARAVLARPRILIMDEATSSVDTRTELLIQSGLQELLQGRTSFVIAHRLSTIRDADQVIFIQDGRIAERGTHEELLAQQGLYHDLYVSQFRTEVEAEPVECEKV
ncbi:MAG TPA: ABC transporter ATP-binding protein [Anaerolineae bacterium]|nr:ABC transporter ATP-binding protein [Anaerolineae bacterium]